MERVDHHDGQVCVSGLDWDPVKVENLFWRLIWRSSPPASPSYSACWKKQLETQAVDLHVSASANTHQCKSRKCENVFFWGGNWAFFLCVFIAFSDLVSSYRVHSIAKRCEAVISLFFCDEWSQTTSSKVEQDLIKISEFSIILVLVWQYLVVLLVFIYLFIFQKCCVHLFW